MPTIKYTNQPLYSHLSDIRLFENVSVKCTNVNISIDVLVNETVMRRVYPRETYLIVRNGVTYVYGSHRSEKIAPANRSHTAQVFDKDLTPFREYFNVAKRVKGQEVYIRQRGPNRGHAYYQIKEYRNVI